MKKHKQLGIEFEQSRPKLKKDKKYFSKLEYKERDEADFELKPSNQLDYENNNDILLTLPVGIK